MAGQIECQLQGTDRQESGEMGGEERESPKDPESQRDIWPRTPLDESRDGRIGPVLFNPPEQK